MDQVKIFNLVNLGTFCLALAAREIRNFLLMESSIILPS